MKQDYSVERSRIILCGRTQPVLLIWLGKTLILLTMSDKVWGEGYYKGMFTTIYLFFALPFLFALRANFVEHILFCPPGKFPRIYCFKLPKQNRARARSLLGKSYISDIRKKYILVWGAKAYIRGHTKNARELTRSSLCGLRSDSGSAICDTTTITPSNLLNIRSPD